jgi:hypothetical protein
MERTMRLIFLAVFVALGIYRFIRSMKAGVSKRPLPGIPATGGILAPIDPTAPTGSGSIVGPGGESGGNAALARFAAAVVFLAGNAALWLCLFRLPSLEAVPVIWRLVAGILVNFYLLGLARAVGVRLRGRGRDPALTGGNPFPDS